RLLPDVELLQRGDQSGRESGDPLQAIFLERHVAAQRRVAPLDVFDVLRDDGGRVVEMGGGPGELVSAAEVRPVIEFAFCDAARDLAQAEESSAKPECPGEPDQ